MKIKKLLYNSIQNMLYKFDYSFVRRSNSICLEASLQGLLNRGYRPTVIFDIGASDGKWTKKVLKYFPNANYYLVDPLYENEQMLHTLSLHAKNVHYLISCVGNYDGNTKIYIAPDRDCSNLFEGGDDIRIVPIKKLDSLIQEKKLPIPDFLKLDVQGFELEVLKGLIENLKDCELILLEQQFFRFASKMNLLHESIMWMAEHGFRPYEFVDFMRRPLDGAMGQCDLLYINEKSKLLSDSSWS